MNTIEELLKVSQYISGIQTINNGPAAVDIAQLTLTAEATLASIRTRLRERKRTLEERLANPPKELTKLVLAKYLATILLEYIDDPSITELVRSL